MIGLGQDDNFVVTDSCDCDYYTNQSFTAKFQSCDDNISILHLNIRSLSKNWDPLLCFLHSVDNYKFTVLAITETWLNNYSPVDILQIEGYRLINVNRNNRRGGGVAIFVREHLTVKVRYDIAAYFDESAEVLFIELENAKLRNSLIGVVYRPPDRQLRTFIDHLSECLFNTNLEKKNYFLLEISTSIY